MLRASPRLCAILSLSSLAACGYEKTAQLADYDAAELQLEIVNRHPETLFLRVRLAPPPRRLGEPCFALAADVVAELNGVPIAMDSPGGASNIKGGDGCWDAVFAGNVPLAALGQEQTLALTDATRTVTLATSTLERARLIQAAEAPPHGAVGEWVHFDWTPASDDLRDRFIVPRFLFFDADDPELVPEEQSINHLATHAEVEAGVGTIAVRIPPHDDALSTDLTGFVRFATTASPPISACSGVASCRVVSEQVSFETRIEIDRP
jgi:hypothetical protein